MIRSFRRIKMSSRFGTAVSVVFLMAALFSCVDNDRTLGEQFISEDYVLKVSSDNLLIPFEQRVHDTIQAISYSTILVGYMTDDTFGTTVVGGGSIVLPVEDSCYLGINPKLVDVYVELSVDSTVVYNEGSESVPQNIYLYEITKDVAGDSLMVYNNSITPDCLSENPISVGSPMLFGDGTVKISLTREYGEKLLSTSPTMFKDMTLFLEKNYGIYVAVDKPDKYAEGGRMNCLDLSASVITVEYLMTDPEKGFVDKDTTVSFVFGYGFALNQFSSGSNHLVTKTPKEVLYLDGLSGVKPVVPADSLKRIIDEWASGVCKKEKCGKESILLSQAKLILPYTMPEESYTSQEVLDRFEKEHPTKIFPFTTNVGATDSTVRMEPLEGIAAAAGGYMDRNQEYYYCLITDYIQEMITREPADVKHTDDLWICPVYSLVNSSTYVTSYILDVSSYQRLILDGPASSRPPRLELVYGILKDW